MQYNPFMGRILLGLDFGAAELKVVALDIKSGRSIGISSCPYKQGIIENHLPNGARLPKFFSLQHPEDWIDAMTVAVRKLMAETRIPKEEVASIGVSFTSCTTLPVFEDGSPLCLDAQYSANPHAWPKLWKHYASREQAKRLTKVAEERGEPFLENYGGKISSEWLWPKLLETLENAPELSSNMAYYLEGGDWIVWQLTGRQTRNQCAAGYKACYVDGMGYPSGDYLASVNLDLADMAERVRAIPVLSPGRFVAGLTTDMAHLLGLKPGTPVGAAVVDAQVGVAGAGVFLPNILVMVLSSSTCHLVMSKEERLFQGLSGTVKNGILDGFWGYESVQPATGDIIEWFMQTLAPMPVYERSGDDDVDPWIVLDRYISEVPAGSNGLLSLDWWDGNKSILLNTALSGMIAGFTIHTTPDDIFKCIIEGSAFGARRIVENYASNGIEIKKIVATGELPFKSPSIVQVFADILNVPITVPDSKQSVARGAAIIGGLAVGVHNLGYSSREDYFSAMIPPEYDSYKPNPENVAVYNKLYSSYLELHDYFGVQSNVLAKLRKG